MRSSGILLHITSLPSHYGVGTLAETDKFIRFLKKSKQSYWQILPVTPTDFVNSPYASPSAFAGNTLLIDVEKLRDEGLVSAETVSDCKKARGNDYGYAIYNKDRILREAFKNFVRNNPPQDYVEFCEQNSFWLNDYALFCAVKKHFGGKSWLEWDDEDIRMRTDGAMKHYSDMLSDEVDFNIFCQYLFFSQWKQFRKKLHRNGIKLIGDIPIYVAYDSADVWAHSQLFELTSDRRPSWVAGVPPDYFSADGQLWGNPLYDWKYHKKTGYEWWMQRIAYCYQLYDVLRIDHFRGFDEYWFVPYGDPTAQNGHWEKGPGYELFAVMKKKLGKKKVIAEDLGFLTPSVIRLVKKTGYPGMKILQFAFDAGNDSEYLPHNYDKN